MAAQIVLFFVCMLLGVVPGTQMQFQWIALRKGDWGGTFALTMALAMTVTWIWFNEPVLSLAFLLGALGGAVFTRVVVIPEMEKRSLAHRTLNTHPLT